MSPSRRTFIRRSAALPVLALPREQAEKPVAQHSSFDPWVEVHGGHLRSNASAVFQRTRVPILAVIKNNGYGAGVVNVAQALEQLEFVRGFAVIKLHEAVTLRDAGVRKPILLMGPVPETDLADIAKRDITLMVYTPIGDALGRASENAGRPMTVHICVDTGLGRVGVPHARAFDLIRTLASAKGVRIEGMMMTFTEDDAFDREQLRRFQELSAQLEAAN